MPIKHSDDDLMLTESNESNPPPSDVLVGISSNHFPGFLGMVTDHSRNERYCSPRYSSVMSSIADTLINRLKIRPRYWCCQLAGTMSAKQIPKMTMRFQYSPRVMCNIPPQRQVMGTIQDVAMHPSLVLSIDRRQSDDGRRHGRNS